MIGFQYEDLSGIRTWNIQIEEKPKRWKSVICGPFAGVGLNERCV